MKMGHSRPTLACSDRAASGDLAGEGVFGDPNRGCPLLGLTPIALSCDFVVMSGVG